MSTTNQPIDFSSAMTPAGTARKFFSKPLTLSTAGILSLAMVASAQVNAQNDVSVLEEIVITAERREVNLQDTPVSATVLSAEGLIKNGIDNVSEMQQIAPSLAINSYNRSTFINIRGVGIAQSAPTSNPGVAYYLDGVFFPHEQFIGQSFFDLGSVEVLRGPQGTLTGQNSTGGAIYVRSPDPSTDEVFGYIDQTLATDGWYRTVGAVNIPLSDIAALRLAALYENKDGHVENLGTAPGMDPGSSEMLGLRANLLLTPSEGQSYNLRLETFDMESGNIAVKDRQDTNPDPFQINYDGHSYLDQKGYRASLEGRWDLSDSIQLRALYSDQDGYTKDQSDGDRSSEPAIPVGLPANGANRALYPGRISRAQTDFETSILEVNLLSIDDSMVQWVVGAFQMSDDVPVELYRDNYSTAEFTSSNSDIVAVAENTSTSLFGQADIAFNDAFSVTLGLRRSEDEQVYTRFNLPGPPPPGCFPCTTTQESSETTGRLGANYYINDDTMAYLTFSKGYKAGGVNLDPRQGFFEPEINEVVEVGVKTTLDDGRLRLNANYFFSDYQDIQLASLIAFPGTPPLPVTQNAASADISGLELELQGAYGQFSFNAGLSLIDGTFAETVVLNDTITGGNQTVNSGDTLPFSPELTYNFGLQYEIEAGDMIIIPRLQVSYLDEQLATPFRHPETIVEDRTIVDAKVTIEPSEALMIEAFVTNLLDEEYVASKIQDSSSADGGSIYGAPLQVGVRVKYDF